MGKRATTFTIRLADSAAPSLITKKFLQRIRAFLECLAQEPAGGFESLAFGLFCSSVFNGVRIESKGWRLRRPGDHKRDHHASVRERNLDDP